MANFFWLIFFPEIKNITNIRSNIVPKNGLLGPKRSYERPAAIAPRKVPRLCKPCRFPYTAPCPTEFSRREIRALKLGVTSPVPIASIATPVYTSGIEVSMFASVKRIHPVITKPIPVKVNFDSPNLFTKGPIKAP